MSVAVDGGEQFHATCSRVYQLAPISLSHKDVATQPIRDEAVARISLKSECSGRPYSYDDSSESRHFGTFTCWQVCPFAGGGNDMSSQNPHALKQNATTGSCA